MHLTFRLHMPTNCQVCSHLFSNGGSDAIQGVDDVRPVGDQYAELATHH